MSNKNKQINLDENALYLEYTKGVNPIRAGNIKSIPFNALKPFPQTFSSPWMDNADVILNLYLKSFKIGLLKAALVKFKHAITTLFKIESFKPEAKENTP